uniref:Uncharacterized protein n=1 Tax=Anguilla anguilla TaxID=7936 RepID=A0A0E9WEX9_ANGAN
MQQGEHPAAYASRLWEAFSDYRWYATFNPTRPYFQVYIDFTE